jgi:hypothetical protein
MQRLRELNRALKRYDRRLYAKYQGEGMYYICWSDALVNKLIFALTDTWQVSGTPVPWGIEPIIHRLRSINASERDDLFNELRNKREGERASNERKFKNDLEAGLLEKRRSFAKAFDDINTSILDKKKDKRRLKDGH